MKLLVAILLLLVATPAWAQQGQGMSQALVVSSCGGGALPSGPVTNLTMDTTGRLCQSGIGSNVCSQATAYLARTVGGNEGGNAVNITALICGLVTDGVITGTLTGTAGCGANLDALYVLAQQNVTDALLNLCGTNFSLTQDTPPATFTTFKGFNGFTGGLSTGYNPGLGGLKFTRNSASFGIWSYAVVLEGIGQITNNGGSHMFNDFPGGLFYARVNDSSGPSVPQPGSKGLFVGDRSSSSTTVPYWNGASQGGVSSTSAAVDNGNFVLGIGFGTSAQTLCEAHIGASLGATLNLALYTRLRTYMTAAGVP